jgi:isoleucyl-tRNA synthetase
LAEFWQQLRKIRTDVNVSLESFRAAKEIGSSLEAKVLLYVSDLELRKKLQSFNPNSIDQSNGVDELRYLFLVSQVELVDFSLKEAEQDIKLAQFLGAEKITTIDVVKAEGEKCDRCWNYSTHVGESAEHPLLCERCVPALAGEF